MLRRQHSPLSPSVKVVRKVRSQTVFGLSGLHARDETYQSIRARPIVDPTQDLVMDGMAVPRDQTLADIGGIDEDDDDPSATVAVEDVASDAAGVAHGARL